MTFKSVLPFALVLTAACSVTQETTPVEVQLDPAVAKSQASALTTAVASAEADDGLAITEALGSVSDTSVALVPKTKSGARRRLVRSTVTCACDAAARRCDFDGCRIGSATVAGSVAWGDGVISCAGLSVDVPSQAGAVSEAHATIECALTYGEGSVAGDVRSTGRAVVDGVTYTWDATLVARDVTFTSSALTGGAVEAKASVTTSSATRSEERLEASASVSLP